MTTAYRLPFVLATTASVALALLPATTVHAAAARDEVSGKGVSPIAAFEFSGFNLGTTPDKPAGGQWQATNPLVDFKGPITCLHVDGNRAGFVYPIEQGSKPEAAVGQAVLIFIEDNGDSGDKMGFVGPAPASSFGSDCAPGPTPVAITEGGVTVRDAK
ncbi:MAG: hypothetical protein ACT4QG_15470 [Sporichthyaceae bacterium]